MGITCASDIFTEAIRVWLSDLPCQLNMTNDALVFGKTAEEHHKNLMAVLRSSQGIGLAFNRKKCEFYKKESKNFIN